MSVATVTLSELRTAHAVARLLLAGGRPMLPHWSAESVRALASELTGATYPRGKKGLEQASAHIVRAIELAAQA
jgi:hypothetical protein